MNFEHDERPGMWIAMPLYSDRVALSPAGTGWNGIQACVMDWVITAVVRALTYGRVVTVVAAAIGFAAGLGLVGGAAGGRDAVDTF